MYRIDRINWKTPAGAWPGFWIGGGGLERVKRANKGVWGHRPQRLKKFTLIKD